MTKRQRTYDQISYALLYWRTGTMPERSVKTRVKQALENYTKCQIINRRGQLKICIGHSANDRQIWQRITDWDFLPTEPQNASAGAAYILAMTDEIIKEFEIIVDDLAF